jgi:hypothetical protein
MAFECQQGVIGGHTLAVVFDGNQSSATSHDIYLDTKRPRIKGILQELLRDGSRAFDHFTGRNLVRQRFGQDSDL